MRSNSNPRLRLHPEAEGLSMVLGPLELAVMQAIWEASGEITNKEVRYGLSERGMALALPTIGTTTKRLAEKGYLHERSASGMYLYTATMTEDELEAYVVEHIMSRLRASWPDLVEGCAQCELEYGHHD